MNQDNLYKIRESLRNKITKISSFQYNLQYINVFIGFKIRPLYYEQGLVYDAGGRYIKTFRYIPVISASIPISGILNIIKYPDIEYIEEVGEAQIMVYNDMTYNNYINSQNINGQNSQRYYYSLEQSVPWGITKIKAQNVHIQGNKGSGIRACIIDTGIDYNHEDLKNNYKGGYNFIANSNDPMDDNGHGTHVAGIIGASDNGIGVIGVAPEVSIYSIKVLSSSGSGSYVNIINAIEWAMDNNMNIINMSLAGSSFSQALKDACDNAYNYGILLIAAAGNNGVGLSCSERKTVTPCPIPDCSLNNVCYPALFDSVVAVSATDSNDLMACFSSRGPKVEVCAPGVSILSTVPKGTCAQCDPVGYKQLSGTSMACPHVVGLSALIWTVKRGYTNTQIRECLRSGVIDLGGIGKDNCYGYGLIQAPNAIECTIIPPSLCPDIYIQMTIPT